MSYKIELTGTDGPEISLRQIYLGFRPAIYIEPELSDDDEEIDFTILGVDMDLADLAELLEAIAADLRESPEVQQAFADREVEK